MAGDTLYRHWSMLRLIPRGPQKISVAQLHARLTADGFKITRRSIERDLPKLALTFPLETDGHKPAGWWWSKVGESFEIPGMSLHAAVTLDLVAQQLQHLLPRSTLQHLAPQLKRASALLKTTREQGLPRWRDAVRAIPTSQPRLPPRVAPEVIDTVYDALLSGKMLKVSYAPRDGSRKQYEMHPLGLVFRESIGYLIATLWNYDDVLPFALHRMKKPSVLDENRRIPQGFDLDRYLEDGLLAFRVSDKHLKIQLLVDKDAGPSFVETPLAADQVVSRQKDGRLRIKATVADTQMLRSWLCSFGPGIEVLGPAALRRDVAERLRQAAARYR